jgi:hypothetical protein
VCGLSDLDKHNTGLAMHHLQKSLISIAKEEVFGTDILVWVFGSLLQRRHMRPMLPMLRPEVVGVETRKCDTGNNDTIRNQLSPAIVYFILSRIAY